jgi:hypothetical protein
VIDVRSAPNSGLLFDFSSPCESPRLVKPRSVCSLTDDGCSSLGQAAERAVRTDFVVVVLPCLDDARSCSRSVNQAQFRHSSRSSYGVKIETLDNPGWLVTVELNETTWEQLVVPRKIVQRSEADWVQCEVANAKFTGSGGAENLEEVLELFFNLIK